MADAVVVYTPSLPPKNKRRPKFTLDELEVLVDDIHCQKNILLSKFTDAQAAQTKNNAWRAIAAKVSAVANVGRTADEIRRKWQDWASVVKQKELSRQKSAGKTGGGIEERPIVLTAIEETVLAILGSTACEGVAGAIDSHSKLPPQKKQKVRDDVEVPAVGPQLSPPPLQPRPVGVGLQPSPVVGVGLLPPLVPAGLQLQAVGAQRPMSRAEASQLMGRNAEDASESDEVLPCVATPCRRPRATPTVRKGRTTPVVAETADIVNIERERLVVEKERLNVEKERLQVEKCRLDVDVRKCDILEQMLAVEKSKLESLCHQSLPHGLHVTQRDNDMYLHPPHLEHRD